MSMSSWQVKTSPSTASTTVAVRPALWSCCSTWRNFAGRRGKLIIKMFSPGSPKAAASAPFATKRCGRCAPRSTSCMCLSSNSGQQKRRSLEARQTCSCSSGVRRLSVLYCFVSTHSKFCATKSTVSSWYCLCKRTVSLSRSVPPVGLSCRGPAPRHPTRPGLLQSGCPRGGKSRRGVKCGCRNKKKAELRSQVATRRASERSGNSNA
mmetsp:Transcript_44227/g.94239  ORF Transcript_44227/g.94239 Transcript_44227/m.94239 type:complete len:208 (+) Transcript_44227:689-1312(+)